MSDQITSSQHRYILALKDGPKSTHDLVLAVMVTAGSVNRMMERLESLGIVKCEEVLYAHGWRFQYELQESYKDLMERVTVHAYQSTLQQRPPQLEDSGESLCGSGFGIPFPL